MESGRSEGSEVPNAVASSSKKRSIPITASAFSFNVQQTPNAKKPRQFGHASAFDPNKGSNTPASTSKLSQLSPFSVKDSKKSEGVRGTPKKSIFQTLDSLPSPLLFRRPGVKVENQDGTPGRKLNQILDEPSPLRPVPRSDGKGEGGGSDEIQDEDEVLLPGHGMAERVGKKQREVRVQEMDEEGIGVSPRKNKNMKWSNTGVAPLSVQLSSLVRSTDSSLILYYNSLLRQLAPPPTPRSSSQNGRTPRTNSGASQTVTSLVESAPLVLNITGVTRGPSHQATMMRAHLQSSSQGKHDHYAENEDEGMNEVEKQQEDVKPEQGEEVMVVFRSLPSDCPKLGLDPRVIAGRSASQQSFPRLTVGIWPPWTEVDTPKTEHDINIAEEDNQEDAGGDDERGPEDQVKTIRTIFASRYLIADIKRTSS